MKGDARIPFFVLGGGGMLTGELLRLVELHPRLEIAGVSTRDAERTRAIHVHVAPRGLCSLAAEEEVVDEIGKRLAGGERLAVFLGLPHGQSVFAVRRLLQAANGSEEGLFLVDLSADFRLSDPEVYSKTYGRPHPLPELLDTFVYGLPELRESSLEGARRIAAPGCFATALQLAVVPAARAGILDHETPWTLFGITGSSGSGTEPAPNTHHPHRHGNLWAYGLSGHRHEAELRQAILPLGVDPPLHFLPHSGPMARGIHLTASLPLSKKVSKDECHATYVATYEGRPFVRVLEGRVPDLRSVAGSNTACLGVSVRGDVLTVLCTLDNIVKGGAGQGLQSLNLALGWPETWGLPRSGLGVC